MLEETLKLKTKTLGPDHPSTVVTRNEFAIAATFERRPNEVVAGFEETLKRRIAELGPDNPETLISQTNLAVAYWKTGRLDQSIPLFERTLKSRIKTLGPTTPRRWQQKRTSASITATRDGSPKAYT